MSGQANYLRSLLPDIGEGIKAALETLHRDPNPDAAEMMAIRLDGARRHCQQLAEAVRREGQGGNGPQT